MNKTRIIAKTIAMLVFILLYKVVMCIIEPIVASSVSVDLAMLQMQNAEYSTTAMQIYTYVKNYAWVGLALIACVVYCKEIFELINLLTEKGDNNNEEN